MNLLKKSVLASIGVVVLALTLALTNVAQVAGQALKDVVVVNTTSQPVPVVAQGTTAIKGTVGLDPAANTVRAQQSGTWNVGITNSSLPVTGTVNVGNQPPFKFDTSGNLLTAGTVSQGRTAVVVLAAAGNTPFDSLDLAVGQFTELALDLNFPGQFIGDGGCGPSPLTIQRKGADGNYYVIDSIDVSPAALPGGSVSRSLGVGAPQNVSFGSVVRMRLTTSCKPRSFSLSVIGK